MASFNPSDRPTVEECWDFPWLKTWYSEPLLELLQADREVSTEETSKSQEAEQEVSFTAADSNELVGHYKGAKRRASGQMGRATEKRREMANIMERISGL